jgi:hypothetical protein
MALLLGLLSYADINGEVAVIYFKSDFGGVAKLGPFVKMRSESEL